MPNWSSPLPHAPPTESPFARVSPTDALTVDGSRIDGASGRGMWWVPTLAPKVLPENSLLTASNPEKLSSLPTETAALMGPIDGVS